MIDGHFFSFSLFILEHIEMAGQKKYTIINSVLSRSIFRLRQSDLLLTHLQSFPLNPVNYKLPDSIKNGLSLFYTSQQSSTPNLNAQHNTK